MTFLNVIQRCSLDWLFYSPVQLRYSKLSVSSSLSLLRRSNDTVRQSVISFWSNSPSCQRNWCSLPESRINFSFLWEFFFQIRQLHFVSLTTREKVQNILSSCSWSIIKSSESSNRTSQSLTSTAKTSPNMWTGWVTQKRMRDKNFFHSFAPVFQSTQHFCCSHRCRHLDSSESHRNLKLQPIDLE